MKVLNDILNNKVEIEIGNKRINAEDIEKIERKIFSFSKNFKIGIRLKNGERIYENYDTLREFYKSYEKVTTEAGFDFITGRLIEDRLKYINGNIYYKDLIIVSKEILAIKKIHKSMKGILYLFKRDYNITKIEIYTTGGNIITLENNIEYDFNQLKKILELKSEPNNNDQNKKDDIKID